MQAFIVHPITRFLILFCVLGGMTAIAHDETGLKARISNIVFETYMKAKPREASGKMLFVDIDDKSVSKIGQWPWPRKTIAEMIENIDAAGASVIIFDGVLAEPDRTSPENVASLLDENHPAKHVLSELPSNDDILAKAIQNTNKFVAGFTHGSNPSSPKVKSQVLAMKNVKNFIMDDKNFENGYFQTTAQFLPSLQKASAGNGNFMASAEADSVIRRTGLIFHDGKTLYPSLVLEGVRLDSYAKTGKQALIKIKATEGFSNFKIAEPFTVSIGDYEIPMSADRKMWVNFRKFSKDENIPAHRFIHATNLPNIDGKIVFIASSAEGLMDLRATPLGMQPGVRVHMNALEQILQNEFLIRPVTADLLEIGTAFIIGLLVIILSFFVNPLWLALIVATSCTGALGISWHLFDQHGGLFDPVTPGIIMIFVSMVASILSYLKTELEKHQVRNMFGHYVSRDVMRDLERNPDKLKLGGENKDLTIMFTDIRSFTTISEGLTPEELIHLMNEFLTAMTDIVQDNEGTIDKYMGDAMMAFWNAPRDVKNHERAACRAALKMQSALNPVNENIKKRAEKQGREPVLLKAGIGLNTGLCSVGNMGSRQRFAYSTLGDAVNLASRLEGQTKNYGIEILIGENTRKAVQDFACLEMDLIQVKGKTEAVRIFALLGDEKRANEESFLKLEKQHKEMLSAYRTGDFETAKVLAEKCSNAQDLNLEKAYSLYIGRCSDLISNPPQDWDGVFVATSK